MNTLIRNILIACFIQLPMISFAAAATPENPFPDVDWKGVMKDDCFTLHRCESLVKCPANRTCFNNCDIGFDGGVVGRKVGNFFLNLFGGEIEESNLQGCYANCYANIDKYCAGPQPTDTSQSPALDDPALTCRQYCGAEKNIDGQYGWCEATCRNLDRLTACYKSARDPEAECDPVALVSDVASQNTETHMRNAPQVQEKMRGFAYEALCVRKPTAKRCETLCNDHADLRWCQIRAEAKARAEQEVIEKREAAVDAGVAATEQGAEAAGQTGKKMLKQMQTDKQAYSDEMGAIDRPE
jgi:hypothetical protein